MTQEIQGDIVSTCAKCIASKGKSLCTKCSKDLTKEKRKAQSWLGSTGAGKIITSTKGIMMEDIIDKIDRLLISEVTVVGGSYIDGTITNVTGSGQTRAGFEEKNVITTMQQKEPGNRKSVKFNKLLGGYVPTEQQPDQEELRWSMSI